MEVLKQMGSLSNIVAPVSSGLVKDQDDLPVVGLVFPLIQDVVEKFLEVCAIRLYPDHEKWRFVDARTGYAAEDMHRF